MVRLIFFGYVHGAKTVASFANMPETTSNLDSIARKLTVWKNFGEKSSHPTWIRQDIKRTRETAEAEIRKKREKLEGQIERCKRGGVLVQTPFIHEQDNGQAVVGFTVRLTKDITTVAKRNGTGEFEVAAIPNDAYRILKRRKMENGISKCLFTCAAIFTAFAAYMASDIWFGVGTILQFGFLRVVHSIMLNLNPVFRQFKTATHTDVALRFLENAQKEIMKRLEKLEQGIDKITTNA